MILGLICSPANSECLREQVQFVLDEHHISGLSVVDDLHVSLFRGHFKLRIHQVQPFINDLTSRVSKVPKFKLILNRVDVLRNDEKTRSFICLKIDPYFKNPLLDRLINDIENCLHEFEGDNSKEKYQDTFITHSSLIWYPGDISEDKEAVNTLVDTLKQEFEEDPLKLEVASICVKAGNQTFLVPLKS